MVNESMTIARRARRVGLLAALVVLVALGLAPGAQAACSNTLSQKFLKWNDSAWYTLAPGGSMESSSGWTLSGGASIVSGNETWYVNSTTDTRSLSLPSGSKATSAYMCVDGSYPYFRLFRRNTGSTTSKLKVEVLYRDPATGSYKALSSGNLSTGNTSWALTNKLAIATGQIALQSDGTGLIAFRFTPLDSTGKWQIDDLYVDPRRR